MKHSLNCIFLVLAIAADTSLAAGTPTAAINPHDMPVGAHRQECLNCHTGFELTASTVNGSLVPSGSGDGIRTCINCHETASVKHMVGKRPDFKVPNYLPLDEQGRITCLTCHYQHGPLHSDKPWVSVSWLERLSNSERLHKTFLLRRNNTHGDLCMTCHDA